MSLRDVGQQLLAQKRAAYTETHHQQEVLSGIRPNNPQPHSQHEVRGGSWLCSLAGDLGSAAMAVEQTNNNVRGLPETVAINPALLCAFVRNEQSSAGRLWLLCRAIDGVGSGVLSLPELRRRLTDKTSYFGSWRRLRQVLAEGEGVFWTRTSGKQQLYLAGAAKVGQRLKIDRLARRNILLPVAELLNGVQRARAAFYAAFHAGRDSNPIARATIATVTGVSERSQRSYDKITGVQREANYTLMASDGGKESAENSAWQRGRASFAFTDSYGQQGTAGKRYYATRLPNSYQSTLKRAANGRRRKIARKLKDALVTMGVQGNIDKQPKLFHRNGRSAAQASKQQGDVYLHLHNTPQNKVRGDKRKLARYGWWHQLNASIAHS